MYKYDPSTWWVNNVLPLVYDDSLSYYEVLSKLRYYIAGLTGDVKKLTDIVNTIEGIEDVEQFTEYLNSINAKIGELENLQTANKSDIVSAINSVVLDLGIVKLQVEDKYTKPENGIPESDLNDELKEKINAQFEQSRSYDELTNKPKINHIEIEGDHEPGYYGIGTYSKPENGIPESDLAQTIVDKLSETSDNAEKIDGIAPSVDSYVANREYAIGELVYINGMLYKVTARVPEGAPFVVGGNIEATTINKELEDVADEITRLNLAIGAESYDMNSGEKTVHSISVYTLFFRYFRAIAENEYLFIVQPTAGLPNAPYEINIYNESGEVVYTFDSGTDVEDYQNERRFTFTPATTGNYYCGIKKVGVASGNPPTVQTVILQYTPSQSTESLIQMVSELLPRVGQVESDVDVLEDDVADAIKYSEYVGDDTLGNQTINTLCRVPSTRDIADVPGGLENYGRVVWLLTSGTQTHRLQALFSSANPCRAIAYRLMHNGSWLEWIIVKGRYDLYPTGDNTNRSGDMQSYLTNFGNILLLAPGDYYIRAFVMPQGTSIVGCGVGITRIICTDINSWCAIKMSSHCSIKDVSIIFDNGFTDENKPTAQYWTGKHAIGIGSNVVNYSGFTNEVECLVENVAIDGFTGCGIFSACTTNENKGSMFNNVRITHCSCGIYLGNHSEFNIALQCVLGYCYTGMILMGGNNIVESCDIAMHEIGVNLVETDYYCDDGHGHGAANDGHGTISNCKMGHMGWMSGTLGSGAGNDGGYAIIRDRQSSATLIANTYITGPVLADHGGQNLSFSGCHIRENTKLFAVGAIMIMTGCYFEGNIETVVSENGKIFRRSCLNYLGVELGDVGSDFPSNTILQNEVNNLKSTLHFVTEKHNLVDPAILTASNNINIVNNGDGTYTLPTNDYGYSIFGGQIALDPGYYIIYGTQQGFSFLSTTPNSSNIIAGTQNQDGAEKVIYIAQAVSCYLGFRITSNPTVEFMIAPFIEKATEENVIAVVDKMVGSKGRVDAGTDLNDIRYSGIYNLYGIYTNAPDISDTYYGTSGAVNGTLFVINPAGTSNAQYIVQIIYCAYPFATFYRIYNSATWYRWNSFGGSVFGDLVDGVNLNDVRDTGLYSIDPTTYSYTNYPLGSYTKALLYVVRGHVDTDAVLQILYPKDNGSAPLFRFSAYNNNAWVPFGVDIDTTIKVRKYTHQNFSPITYNPQTAIKLKVGTFNIGHFNYGDSDYFGIKPGEYDMKLHNWRQFLCREQFDVLNINEFVPYIDYLARADELTGTKLTTTYLLKPQFMYFDSTMDAARKDAVIASKYAISDAAEYTLNGTSGMNTGYCKYHKVTIDENHIIGVYGIQFPYVASNQYNPDSAESIANRLALLASLKTVVDSHNDTYVIIMGDFNTATETDYTNMSTFGEDNSLLLCNGGYLDWMRTHNNYNSCLDNILVSANIHINNFESLRDWYGPLSSDHYAISAEVILS